MSKRKKDNPGEFVRKTDCAEMMEHGDEQFKEIRTALVGDKFGKIGGIVKEINEIKTQLATVTGYIEAQSRKSKWIARDKALILVAIIGVLGSIITAIISRF